MGRFVVGLVNGYGYFLVSFLCTVGRFYVQGLVVDELGRHGCFRDGYAGGLIFLGVWLCAP